LFAAFNANTDPSRYRKGQGKGAGKGMASLKLGVYRAHNLGKHKGQYEALIQTGGPVTVIRDGNPPYEDSGYFGINIHKGGFNTTSSEGCQTIHPTQWPSFIAGVTDQVKRLYGKPWRTVKIPYVLVEQVAL
jgi:lysozyme